MRDAFLAALTCPLVKLPPNIGDEALFGGIDVAATLQAGQVVHTSGLLARRGLKCLTMAERCPPALCARLAQYLDGGEGVVLALDEGY